MRYAGKDLISLPCNYNESTLAEPRHAINNNGYGMNDSQLFHVIHEIISPIFRFDVFNSAELENLLLVVWC